MESLEQFLGPLRAAGLDPSAYPLGLPLAFAMRWARASLPWFNSGWMYSVALILGTLIGVEAWVTQATLPSLAMVHCFTFMAVTLSAQRILQYLADKNDWAWLPKDNAMVKEEQK